MVVIKRRSSSFFDVWFPFFVLIVAGSVSFLAYNEQWLPALIVLLCGLLWAIFSFRTIRPAFAGLVFRRGSRVIISETIQHFRMIDGQKQDMPEDEFISPTFDLQSSDIKSEVTSTEYLTRKEGWTFVFPIWESIVEVSLRQHKEEINEKKKDETEENYKSRAESFSTGEGVNIFPEVFFSYKVTNPGKVFELGGGIDENGDSEFLAESLHDLVIGGARGVLAKMELTKILSRETKDENGNAMPIGEKVRGEIINTPNFDRLGAELLLFRIEDIKFTKEAQDVLDALEDIKKKEFSRQSQVIEADTRLQVQKKDAETMIALANANLARARAEASALNAAIAAFVGKKVDEKTTIKEGKDYAKYQIGLAVARSLETGTKIIIPANEAAKTIAGLINVFDSARN